MKVTRDTPDQLIIEERPIVMAVLHSALALALIGAGMAQISAEFALGVILIGTGVVVGLAGLYFCFRRTQIIFDPSTNQIELRQKSLRGSKSKIWSLDKLEQAIVEKSSVNGKSVYRPSLVFTGGLGPATVPITPIYSTGGGARRAVDAINNWRHAGRA